MNLNKTSLKFFHTNCQSLNNHFKIHQIENIIKHDIDIFSFNETFFKTRDNFSIKNFKIYRADRSKRNPNNSLKKGGGVVLGISSKINSKPINLEELNAHKDRDEVIGVEIELYNYEKLAIFSIYISPLSDINCVFFDKVAKKYKNLLLLGDFNCTSPSWHCKNTNRNGLILSNLLTDLNLFVLNNDTPSYNQSGNILDLSICSANMLKFFKEFKVLDDPISDHNPTITTFNQLKPIPNTQTINKVDWKKFKEILNKQKVISIKNYSSDSLDQEVDSLTNNIRSALVDATVTLS